MRLLPLGLSIAVVISASPARSQGQDSSDLRAGAWDQSVRLEQQGKLAEARDLLRRGWGASDSYYVTLRVAWLTLQLGQAREAIALYKHAQTLPGAGPETNAGIASAWTIIGFQELEAGDRAKAREAFQQALEAEPQNAEARRGLSLSGDEMVISAELWAAFVRQSLERGGTWNAGAGFVHVPWKLDDTWQLRAAYRYFQTVQPEGSSNGRGPRAPASTFSSTHEHEIYAGGSVRNPWLGLELMGIIIDSSEVDAIAGQGARAWIGNRYGLSVEQGAFNRPLGWSHQVLPSLYVWPSDHVGLSAGVRVTSDAAGDEASGVAGVSVVAGAVQAYLQGHVGTERWPLYLSTPSVIVLDHDLEVGGRGTLMIGLSDRWSLGIQGHVEGIRARLPPGAPESTGSYLSLSLGVQYTSDSKGKEP